MKSIVFVAAAILAVADAVPDWKLGREAVRLAHQAREEEGVQQPVQNPMPGHGTDQGCYSSSGDLKSIGTPEWVTRDKCSDLCLAQNYEVAGTMAGYECFCGHTYPPEKDFEADGKNCNVPCGGYPQHACGGSDYWSIYNTGLQLVVKHYGEDDNKDKTKTSTTTSSTPTPTETKVKETSTAPTETPKDSGGGTNVGGIVAGVVVGVVVIAAAIGGGFLWLRRKRNQEIEEEHRRNAAVNAFMGKPPGSSGSGGVSMTDSRLDPVMAHRRMSDGSIADNQDYSRRILRVTNA